MYWKQLICSYSVFGWPSRLNLKFLIHHDLNNNKIVSSMAQFPLLQCSNALELDTVNHNYEDVNR